MPIVIKEYEWKETNSTVTIHVPLKVGASHKADFFNSRRYIKISYEQYLFEVILLHSTNSLENRCTITDSNTIVVLFKSEPQIWGRLEPNIPKNQLQSLKQQFIKEEHERYQQECKDKNNKKHEMKRVAVHEQVCLDTVQRNAIEDIKKLEKTQALGNICDWVDQRKTKKSVPPMKKCGLTKKADSKLSKTEKSRSTENEEVKMAIPLPRESQTLEIEFTEREFPTPCRESKLEEEAEYLRKQAEARRSAGFISSDIRPEERNPQFLKAKGDEFMKTHNYLGAISAYSFGIKLSSKYADLYVARSGAHLALENYHKTAQDCSTALDLLKPEVPANLEERAICIGRRGIALCKLGMLPQGVSELRASLRLINNKNVSMELNNYENALKQAEYESD